MRYLLVLLLAPAACAEGHFAADWSPDGKWIAVGLQDGVRILDAKTRKAVRTIPAWSTVHAVRFGAKSDDLLFAGKGNAFTLARLDGTVLVEHADVNPVVGFSAARSDDGKVVVSAAPGNTLLVWRQPFERPERELKGGGHVWKYAVTPDGARAVAVSREGRLTAWEVSSGKRLAQADAREGYVFAMQMSADGRLLATGGSARDRTVALWDPKTLGLERRIDAGVIVRALAISPDGKLVAVAGNGKRVDLYETATGKRAGTVEGLKHATAALDFAPGGDRLLVVTFRGQVLVRPFRK